MGGVNILTDIVFAVIPGGADDGAFTPGTPVTVKFDTVTITEEPSFYDGSTAQDAVPQNRANKLPWTAEFETKLSRTAAAGLTTILGTNQLVGFTTTEASTAVGQFDLFSGNGTLGSRTISYGEQGATIRFTIIPYGTPLNWVLSAL